MKVNPITSIPFKPARGLTLVELMVTIAVISILAAIGYPAYTNYTYKARRTEATGSLLDFATRMERFYADNNAYPMPDDGVEVADIMGSATTEHDYYTLGFKAQAAQSYTLQAVPGGAQSSDDCGTFTLSSLGVRDVEGGSLAKAKCW